MHPWVDARSPKIPILSLIVGGVPIRRLGERSMRK